MANRREGTMRRGLGFGLLAVGLIGCGDESEKLSPGSVVVSWQVAARGCEASGTPEVRVRQIASDGREIAGREWMFACAAGVGDLGLLEAGTYRFRLDGLTSDGRAIYRGETPKVEVRPDGRTESPTVVLTARPAQLVVNWNFGGPLCAQVDVSRIELLVFDPLGTVEMESEAACDAGRHTLELRPGAWDVAVHGVDGAGVIRHTALLSSELAHGDSRTETVVLQPVTRETP